MFFINSILGCIDPQQILLTSEIKFSLYKKDYTSHLSLIIVYVGSERENVANTNIWKGNEIQWCSYNWSKNNHREFFFIYRLYCPTTDFIYQRNQFPLQRSNLPLMIVYVWNERKNAASNDIWKGAEWHWFRIKIIRLFCLKKINWMKETWFPENIDYIVQWQLKPYKIERENWDYLIFEIFEIFPIRIFILCPKRIQIFNLLCPRFFYLSIIKYVGYYILHYWLCYSYVIHACMQSIIFSKISNILLFKCTKWFLQCITDVMILF